MWAEILSGAERTIDEWVNAENEKDRLAAVRLYNKLPTIMRQVVAYPDTQGQLYKSCYNVAESVASSYSDISWFTADPSKANYYTKWWKVFFFHDGSWTVTVTTKRSGQRDLNQMYNGYQFLTSYLTVEEVQAYVSRWGQVWSSE